MAALFSFSCLFLILLATGVYATAAVDNVPNTEETIADNLRLAFKQNKLASKQLVEFYLEKLYRQNPKLIGVIKAHENALNLADKADRELEYKERVLSFTRLHGINPALVKQYSAHLSEDTTLAPDEFKVALKAYMNELVNTPKLEKIEVPKKAAGLRLAAEKAASEKLARKSAAAGGSSFPFEKIGKILAFEITSDNPPCRLCKGVISVGEQIVKIIEISYDVFEQKLVK